MSSVPAGKRSWKCPECGKEVLLSTTQLDPFACDDCLAKMKAGGSSGSGNVVTDAVAGPLAMWQALPEMTKFGAVALALVVGLLIGYVAGQAMSTLDPPPSRHESARPSESTHPSESPHANDSTSKEASAVEEPEARPDPPGPGYKWVRGRIRKDGTRGTGHWAKDPFYRGDEETSTKKSK